METIKHPSLIVIDDDTINNRFCRILLNTVSPDCYISTFEFTEIGFQHMLNEYANPACDDRVIVFLDIKMPSFTGWDFLDHFQKLDKAIKEKISVYILSGTMDPNDIERAKANPNVNGFIAKPLTANKILEVLHTVHHKAEPNNHEKQGKDVTKRA